MQGILCSKIECSGFHAAWLNAVDSMQWGPMHPDWMLWIIWSMAQIIPTECSGFHAAWLNSVDFMQHDWMQWIPCSVIECSGCYAAWPKYPDWMQWIPCSVAQWISRECSGFHASLCNGAQLNAVNSMQRDWMQYIPCSMVKCIPIKCSGFHPAWLNAVDSMERGPMHPD